MKIVHLLLLAVGALVAQVPNPTTQQPGPPAANTGQPMPIFRVTVVSRTTKAVNYHHRTGTTHIDFRGTEMMPTARGEASVDSQMGSTKIDTRLNHMTPAGQFGPEYMTYVLWAITPEGRPRISAKSSSKAIMPSCFPLPTCKPSASSLPPSHTSP